MAVKLEESGNVQAFLGGCAAHAPDIWAYESAIFVDLSCDLITPTVWSFVAWILHTEDLADDLLVEAVSAHVANRVLAAHVLLSWKPSVLAMCVACVTRSYVRVVPILSDSTRRSFETSEAALRPCMVAMHDILTKGGEDADKDAAWSDVFDFLHDWVAAPVE
jgi:hypothetical protein